MSTSYQIGYQKYVPIVIALLMLLPILPGNKSEFPASMDRAVWESASNPIQVKVEIDRIPTLGQTARVTCTTQSFLDVPETKIELVLPPNVKPVSGTLNRSDSLRMERPSIVSASVQFNELGDVAVSCKALHRIDSENAWGDMDTIYLSIGRTESKLGFADRQFTRGVSLNDGEGSPKAVEIQPEAFVPSDRGVLEDPPSVDPSGEESKASASPSQALAGQLIITGRWGYWNRQDVFVGANRFLVELVRGDNGAHLAWCYTGANGYYSCGPVTNPGAAGIRTYFLSYVSYGPYNDVLNVAYPPCGVGVWCAYFTSSDAYVLGDGTHNIGTWSVPNNNNIEGAYWLKEDLDRAWQFVWNKVGSSQTPQETAGPSTVFWAIDSTNGTYYMPGGQIYLKGQDRFSSDVAIHEYGHNVMYNIYQVLPFNDCPAQHYVQLVSAPNCAWMEGWADFLPLAVNNDPVFSWPDGAFLNIESQNAGTPNWDDGDRVEGRVAGALWDIYDSNNEGSDQFTNGFTNIWDTIFHQNNNVFLGYWLAWKTRGHNQDKAVMSIYQNTIDYRNSTGSLANPSIEADANNDSRPDSWFSTNPIFTRSNAIPPIHGSYVGRLHATNNGSAIIYQTVSGITAGRTYEFSGWVNIPATSDTFNFTIEIAWRRADNTVISFSKIKSYTAQTAGWNEAKASMVVPQGATKAFVKLVVSNLNATIYVDKFSFILK